MLALAYVSHSTQAQVKSHSIEQITYINGQKLNYTRDIFQDTTGLICITGSSNGLLVYDGQEFYSYAQNKNDFKAPFQRVVQLQSLSNGNILLSPQNNILYEFNPYSRLFVDSIISEPTMGVRIYDFEIDKNGSIWAVSFAFSYGNYYYLYKIEPSGVTQIIDTIPINTYAQLFYCQDHIYCNKTNAVRRYLLNGSLDVKIPLRDGKLTAAPFRYATDSQNKLWLKSTSVNFEGSRSGALFKLNESSDAFNKIDLPIPVAITLAKHSIYWR